MTTLEKFMNKHDITVYQVVKCMGEDIQSRHSFWSRKIRAIDGAKMTREEVQKVLKAISETLGKELDLTDFEYEITQVRMR